MKDKINDECINEMDIFHHLLEEQIAYICVMEEEEHLRKEIINKQSSSNAEEGY